ncbi:MAG: hypothetical protein ACJAR2_002761 [Ilumatobacter sp.]
MVAIDWGSLATGAASSLVVALVLWAVLPRGATLTKTHPVTNLSTGEVTPDTWRITNTSAVSIRIVAAEVSSPAAYAQNRPSWFRRFIGKPVHAVHRRLKAPTTESRGSLAWRSLWALRGWVDRVQPFKLPIEGGFGVMLTFDDHGLDTLRYEWDAPWPKQVVPPGETLTLHLLNNTMLDLRYRRAGVLGVCERRSLRTFGYG